MIGQNVDCLMNPLAGRDMEQAAPAVEKKKKILIVGGGPGGLKCAEELAKRGHEVTLYEKESRLGGQLNPCAIPPGKGEFGNAIDYFANQLPKLGVNICLNSEVTPAIIEKEAFDTVIVATGAVPSLPPLAGIKRENVVHAIDVLEGKVHVGQRVVVIGGGGIGCDTALFLAKEGAMDAENAIFLKEMDAVGEDFLNFTHKGKQVTIVEQLRSIGRDMGLSRRSLTRRLLAMNNVEIITEAEVTAITESGVEIQKEGEKQEIEADTVVIASGTIPENKLYDELQGKVPELYIIGDAKEPRRALDAIHEAAALALKI
jgi:2,4-dienoyl-CoA reductase (NADPH2)